MKNKYITMISLMFLLVIPNWALATTYYVAETSAGSGNGRTFSDRMSVNVHNTSIFQPDDRIRVCGGIISSQIVVPSSGSLGKIITYENYHANPATLVHSSPSGAFRISGKDFVTIDGLFIKDGEIGISISNGSDFVTIKRCQIYNMKNKGILVSVKGKYSKNITIGGGPGDGNHMYDIGTDTGGVDIGMQSVQGGVISYNNLHGNGSDTGIDGIGLQLCKKIIIEYNRIYDHMYNGADNGEDGIDLKGSTEITIRYNVIYGHKYQVGVNINLNDSTNTNCSNINVHHNYIFSNGSNIRISDVNENVYIWGNIISNASGTAGILATSSGSNIYIYNNTLVDNGGSKRYSVVIGNGSKYIIKNNIFYTNLRDRMIYKSVNSSNVVLDFNQYYYSAGEAKVNWDGTSYNLAELKAKLGQESSGKEGDPMFTNVEKEDYSLMRSSPCVGSGTDFPGTDYAEGFDVFGTEWDGEFPRIRLANQENFGSWDKGGYVYTGTAKGSSLEAPKLLRLR